MPLDSASAMQAGEAVVGVRPEQGAVQAATAALAARARERATRVRLIWRYAGQAVEAAGPLLGGWGCRLPLQFCARQGCWAAEVQVRVAPVNLSGSFAVPWKPNGLHAVAVLCASALLGGQSAGACNGCQAGEAAVLRGRLRLQVQLITGAQAGSLGSVMRELQSLLAEYQKQHLLTMSWC